MYHSNHIYISQKFLCLSKNKLPQNISEVLELIVEIDGNINTVISHIKQKFYNVNIDYGTVYKIRQKLKDNLLHDCTQKPYGSLVHKLINLLKNE